MSKKPANSRDSRILAIYLELLESLEILETLQVELVGQD